MICPRCRGNGYIKVKESIESQTETIFQCPQCDSKGEIDEKADTPQGDGQIFSVVASKFFQKGHSHISFFNGPPGPKFSGLMGSVAAPNQCPQTVAIFDQPKKKKARTPDP